MTANFVASDNTLCIISRYCGAACGCLLAKILKAEIQVFPSASVLICPSSKLVKLLAGFSSLWWWDWSPCFPADCHPRVFRWQLKIKTYQFLGPCRVAPFIFKINGWESLSHQMPPHPFSLCVQEDLQFSRSVVSDSLRPHELQYARPPCPSQTLGVDSNSCPSSWWCHPAISSSVVPFSSCPQSFQASGLFQWVSSLQQVAKVVATGVSASASVLPVNIQDCFPSG